MQEEVETSIIKSDRAGRARYSKDYKEQVVAAFEQSSLSAAAFADQCGLKYPTFASWVAKSRKNSSQQIPSEPTQSRSPAFVMAEIAASGVSAIGLSIELPGGALLKLTDETQLPLAAKLLEYLR